MNAMARFDLVTGLRALQNCIHSPSASVTAFVQVKVLVHPQLIQNFTKNLNFQCLRNFLLKQSQYLSCGILTLTFPACTGVSNNVLLYTDDQF